MHWRLMHLLTLQTTICCLHLAIVWYKLTIVISVSSTQVTICSLRHLAYFSFVGATLKASGTCPHLSATTSARCISKSLPPLVAVGQSFPSSPPMLLVSPFICNTRNLPSSWTLPYGGFWEREKDPASPLQLKIVSESPALGFCKPPSWPKYQCRT